ncbi:hypothetical protein SDC9_157962 [bioreactor metagenome]|uniref:Uncharacterized protein n=1 Tax=bioreactor metagenome TaxID=1076179 RepID=A0A645F8W1_9ZZZZ
MNDHRGAHQIQIRILRPLHEPRQAGFQRHAELRFAEHAHELAGDGFLHFLANVLERRLKRLSCTERIADDGHRVGKLLSKLREPPVLL